MNRILPIAALGACIVFALMHFGSGEAEWMGMTVSNITPELAMEYNIPKDEKGVVINWCEDEAYASGARSGDLLKAVNNLKTPDITGFLKVARNVDCNQGALLDIMRNGQPLYITLVPLSGTNY